MLLRIQGYILCMYSCIYLSLHTVLQRVLTYITWFICDAPTNIYIELLNEENYYFLEFVLKNIVGIYTLVLTVC